MEQKTSIKKRKSVILSRVEETNQVISIDNELQEALDFNFKIGKDQYKELSEMTDEELQKAYKTIKSKQLFNQIEIQRFQHLLITNNKILNILLKVFNYKKVQLPKVNEFVSKEYKDKEIHS